MESIRGIDYSTDGNKIIIYSPSTGTSVNRRNYGNIFGEVIVNETGTKFIVSVSQSSDEHDVNLVDVGFKEYRIMRNRLLRLFSVKREDLDDEEGAVTPTTYANSKVERILYNTYLAMKEEFYKGGITTSFEGGIRTEWMRPNASVRLVISAHENGKEYIYFELENENGLEAVSVDNLVNRLRWLRRVEKPWPKK